MISIPSVLSDDQRLVNCGRASAILNKVTAATRSPKGTCSNHMRQLFGCAASVRVSLICTLASAFRNS